MSIYSENRNPNIDETVPTPEPNPVGIPEHKLIRTYFDKIVTVKFNTDQTTTFNIKNNNNNTKKYIPEKQFLKVI